MRQKNHNGKLNIRWAKNKGYLRGNSANRFFQNR